jgi:hypothetical protein
MEGFKMEIRHDKSYLYLYEDMKQTGFTNLAVTKVRFEGTRKDNRSIQALEQIKDYLHEHYRLYQYKNKDLKYGEHDLFHWSNSDNYFTIDYNDKDTNDRYTELTKEIVEYVENNYADIEGSLSLQYEEVTDWNKINDYIMNTEFDINNLPFKILQPIVKNAQYTGNTLLLESRDKLFNLESQLLESLAGKKIVYNSINGTLKKIKEGVYGVFKPKATRTYYQIGLSMIQSLKIA